MPTSPTCPSAETSIETCRSAVATSFTWALTATAGVSRWATPRATISGSTMRSGPWRRRPTPIARLVASRAASSRACCLLSRSPAEVITTEQLSRLYDAPIEVLHDSHGHMFVVGLEAESAHHDA